MTDKERVEELETLIKEYYETLVLVNQCPELILSTGRTERAGQLMQDMYEAQSKLLYAVGIDYHGAHASGKRSEP